MYHIIYDFETSGRSARFDQILQAGLVCYNEDLVEINRLNLKSRLNADVIPSIGALKVNKLLISDLLTEKDSHYNLMKKLNNFLITYKPSIFLGYNSINFDEEFLRQAMWEFFKFPYITSTNSNKRGDIFNLATMTHSFDPKAINVDKNEEGKMSFKLESLASVNNFKIENAHEAISDVIATKKILEVIKNNSPKIFKEFFENTDTKSLSEKIKRNDFFTLYGYYFNKHYVYLSSYLIDHPVYSNYLFAFDLKFDPDDVLCLDFESLKDLYYSKKLNSKPFNCFKKIKLNKQPSILDKDYSINRHPYYDIGIEELLIRKEKINDEEFKRKFIKLIESEAESFENYHNFEEETIYSKGIVFKDKIIMEDFEKIKWEEKWEFATKFKDTRLQFFAARHIYRNFPEFLPLKVFNRVHQKISERVNSMNKENFTTLPSAMEEADNLSYEIENNNSSDFVKKQLKQYNIYINFLYDYYNDKNAKPIKFDQSLSLKLFN